MRPGLPVKIDSSVRCVPADEPTETEPRDEGVCRVLDRPSAGDSPARRLSQTLTKVRVPHESFHGFSPGGWGGALEHHSVDSVDREVGRATRVAAHDRGEPRAERLDDDESEDVDLRGKEEDVRVGKELEDACGRDGAKDFDAWIVFGKHANGGKLRPVPGDHERAG